MLSAESLDQVLDWTPLAVRSDTADYGLGVARVLPEYVDGAYAIGRGGNALFYSAVAFYLPNDGVAIGITHNSDFDEFTGVTMVPLVAEVVSVIADYLEPLSQRVGHSERVSIRSTATLR